jgi:putative CocE/NonD family hydrolase
MNFIYILIFCYFKIEYIKCNSNQSNNKNFITEFAPMRDGSKLAVDIYLSNRSGKYPVILEITCYGKHSDLNFKNEVQFWSDNGYVFVIADTRGTGDSEGEFEVFANEGNDGYDLLKWIDKQPWSNGKVGMRGSSYSGTNQWFIAAKKPPSLKCITPTATAGGPFDDPPYQKAFLIDWSLNWMGSSLSLRNNTSHWINYDPKAWLKHKPLNTLDEFVTGRKLPVFRNFLKHPTLDSFWNRVILKPEDYANIDIPSLSFSGWYDTLLFGTKFRFKNVNKYSPNKDDHFLIIGPYDHNNAADGGYDYLTGEKIKTIGDFKLDDNAFLPARNMTREFFDWCLKDKTRPNWKQTRLYISNKWEEGKYFINDDGIQDQYLYLGSNKSANSIKGDGKLSLFETDGKDSYEYDPNEPVRSDIIPNIGQPIDINFYLNRTDFLVYTSDVIKKPFTTFDEVQIELSISSNVKDTDFVAFLMDVQEDGRSIKLGSMPRVQLRTRYREGFDKEVLMEKNKIYNIKINMYEIGHTFLQGHRIRLAITSSFFPAISANPNTGNPIATDTDQPIKSIQTLHYGKTSDRIFSRIHFRTKNKLSDSF